MILGDTMVTTLSFSSFFALFFVLGGSMGIPMGFPPGPEDPVMARLAPEECLLYASWSGVAEIDGDASPTEKWLSQPKASLMIGKLRKAYRGYLVKQSEKLDDNALKIANRLMIEVIDTASVQPAAFYLDDVEIINDSTVKPHGAFVIKLGDREDTVVGLLDEFFKEFELVKESAPHYAFEAVEIDGQRVLKISTGPDGAAMHVVVRDGYFILGLGEGALDQVAKNMATEPPAWLTQLRERLKVERISSVSYVDAKIFAKFKDNLVNGVWPSKFDFAKGVESIGWVAGVDKKGYLCRTELVQDKLEKNPLLELIDRDPIPNKLLALHPADATAAIATRLSTKKTLELIRSSMHGAGQKEMLDKNLAEFHELTGVSLEKELLSSIGDYVSVYYGLGRTWGNRGWVASVDLENEMTFPDYLFQINKGVAAWAEETADVEFKTKKIGEHEINFLETRSYYGHFAWAVVDDKWYLAAVPKDIEKHLNRFSRIGRDAAAEKVPEAVTGKAEQRSYPEDPVVAEILEFGNRSGFGNPIAMSHIDLAAIIGAFYPWVEEMVALDQPFQPGFDFKWSDIPPLKELTNEVTPNFTGVFKTDKGFQVYQRQTYPGAPPLVTAAAAGIVAFPTQFGTVTTKKRMHQIGQAHLAFEKKHGGLCAPYSTGPAGKSLLSWRVHLLPFLGHDELYKKFRLDEPWDSTHNAALASEMPAIYQNPTMRLDAGETAFLVPTAEGTLFSRLATDMQSAPVGMAAADIKDPRSEVLMLMEVKSEHAVVWTRPADYDKLGKDFARMAHRSASSSKMSFVTSDGLMRSVRYWPKERYTNLLQCSDGEKVTFPKPKLFGP